MLKYKYKIKVGVNVFNTRKHMQNEIEFISIEELVPQDHLLRKIDQYIDFSFILEKVRPYYCEDNGRPSLDPLILFKMMFIGYLKKRFK
jgi:transposase